MIKSLSSSITEYLGRNNSSLTKTDLLKINYSLQVVLGDVSKFILIFLIFLFVGQLSWFFLTFALLISTRPLGGGVHCKTYFGCLIVSIIYFFIVTLFSKMCPQLNMYFYIIFFMVSFALILRYAPYPNKKRPINNKKMLKILSIISLTFWMILFFYLSNVQICNCIFISIFFQTIKFIILNIKGVFYNAKICKLIFSHSN